MWGEGAQVGLDPLERLFWAIFILVNSDFLKKNKYAIHAYTHGPVTGSGPSVSLVTSVATDPLVELRVLLVPPSLLPYSANVKLTARISALAVRKINQKYKFLNYCLVHFYTSLSVALFRKTQSYFSNICIV